MPDEVDLPKGKARKFGVFQKKKGSYTLRDARLEPLTVVPVSDELMALACEDTSPVEFFDTKKAADEAVAKLKAKFDAEPKGQ